VATTRRKRQASKQPEKELVKLPFPPPFTVTLTEPAEALYRELFQRSREAEARGDTSNQHCTTFRMVDDAIRKVIPSDPINKNYALHGPLANFFRIAKGRMRIVWAVNSEHRAILIVFISDTPRKEGDAQDPYKVLLRLAKGGYLKNVITEWQRVLAVPKGASVH
jgi:mRNA-degrading endonuclease RelE of RelBE toxin-antitoxin system